MNSLVSVGTHARGGWSGLDVRKRQPKGPAGRRAARFAALLTVGVLILALLPGATLTALAQSDRHISGTVFGPDGTTGLSGIGVNANTGDLHTSTQTGPDGSYSLTVPEGSYTLNFQDYNSAYVSGCYDANDAVGHFTPYQNSACSTVTIVAGGPDATGINVMMPLGRSIEGTVTGPDGVALQNISVMANTAAGSFGTGTDPSGDYLLTVLPGSYTVSFYDDSSNHVNGCYSSSSDGHFTTNQNACTLVPTGGAALGINVVMPLGLRISGTVYGPDGTTGLSGIGVNANAGDFHAGTQTGNGGGYSLMVPSGSYTLNFQDHTATYISGCYDADAGSGHFTLDQNSCSPVVGTASGINVVMPLGVQISGTVYGPDGTTGLANVNVNASSTGNFNAGNVTGGDGTYSITVLSNAAYTMQFHDNSGSHVDGCYSSGGFTTDWHACTPVAVTTAPVNGINVVMPLGLHISGTVYGPDGTTGLANIHVDANADNFNAGTVTGGDGSYSIAVLRGSYTLNFQDNNSTHVDGCYSNGGFTADRRACTPVAVTTDPVNGIDVVMPLGQHISGRVTGADGAGLAHIGVMANNGESGTGTDNEGYYSLTVLPGSYTITFYDDSSRYLSGCYGVGGFTFQFNDCLLVGSAATGIDVVMPLGWLINGRVTAPGGAGLPDISVMADAITGGFGTQTRPDGSYSLMVLPGSYPRISFYDNNSVYASGCYSSAGFTPYQDDCTPVVVIAAPVNGIDVTMPPGQHISGTVSGPDGAPLPDINVFERSGSSYGFATKTGPDGRYSLTVPSGEYTVTFYDSTYAHVSGCYAVGLSGLVAALYSFTNSSDCSKVNAISGATGIDVTLPLPGAVIRTTGTEAIVYPVSADPDGTAYSISLTFADVGDGGSTRADLGGAGPPMSIGFVLVGSPTYYDITTTATYTGSITLCVPYDRAAHAGAYPVLLHWDGTNWVNVTDSFDPAIAMICGTVTALSPFVVGSVAATATSTPTPAPTLTPCACATPTPTPTTRATASSSPKPSPSAMPDTSTGDPADGGSALPLILFGLILLLGAGTLFAFRRWPPRARK